MELIDVRCTTCGGNATVNQDFKQAICDFCRNTFLIKQAFELSKKEEHEILSIKKLNENLIRAVEVDDINSIEFFSNKILSIMPNDINALYYGSYASSKISSPNRLLDFYKNLELDSTNDVLDSIINHIVKHFEIRDYQKIRIFFESVFPDKLNQLDEGYKKKIQLDENYSHIERDVFLCYSSLNQKFAEKIVEKIEKDGNTCWISSRNLRPNDNNNYWENISSAIENCKLFLVISSHDSMFSKDVQKEINLARRFGKKRIEFKIDSSIHTTLFNQFFDGLKWVNAFESLDDSIEELNLRIVDLIYEIEQEKIKSINSENRQANNNLVQGLSNNELEQNNIKREIKELQKPSVQVISFDSVQDRFPYIEISKVSEGFLSALKEIMRLEHEYQFELEKLEEEKRPQRFFLESQLIILKGQKLVEKNYFGSSFFDDEVERNQKTRKNQEIQLENQQIQKHNKNIDEQIYELENKIFYLDDNSIETFQPTTGFLEKYPLSANEKEELNNYKNYVNNFEKTSSKLQKEIGKVESLKSKFISQRNIMKKSIVESKFNANYGQPNIKWIFQKNALKHLENTILQDRIYKKAIWGLISTSVGAILMLVYFIYGIATSVPEIFFGSLLFGTLSGISFVYFIYANYDKLIKTLKQKISDDYDIETNNIIQLEIESHMEKNEDYIDSLNLEIKDLEEKLEPLKIKYQDFEVSEIYNYSLRNIANYVIEKGEASINNIIKKFNLSFNDAQASLNQLFKLGIISEFVDNRSAEVLIAEEELDEYLIDLA